MINLKSIFSSLGTGVSYLIKNFQTLPFQQNVSFLSQSIGGLIPLKQIGLGLVSLAIFIWGGKYGKIFVSIEALLLILLYLKMNKNI